MIYHEVVVVECLVSSGRSCLLETLSIQRKRTVVMPLFGSNTLHLLFLLNHEVSPTIVFCDELLHVGRVELMSLVLALKLEGDGTGVVDRAFADSGAAKSAYGFIQTDLALLRILSGEVDVRNLSEVLNKGHGFWRHHFLVSWRELEPRVPKNILAAWTLFRSLMEDSE